jgi:hypothetical protein
MKPKDYIVDYVNNVFPDSEASFSYILSCSDYFPLSVLSMTCLYN